MSERLLGLSWLFESSWMWMFISCEPEVLDGRREERMTKATMAKPMRKTTTPAGWLIAKTISETMPQMIKNKALAPHPNIQASFFFRLLGFFWGITSWICISCSLNLVIFYLLLCKAQPVADV
jgi:hypothetical protein